MFLVTGLVLAVLMLAATPQGRAAGQAWGARHRTASHIIHFKF